MATTIADLFQEGGDLLTDMERSLMFDILHKVVREVELEIRQTLSALFAKRLDPPRELIKLLANDEIEVAYPILTQSTVLRDDDLIEVTRHRTLEHRLAISIRPTISEAVSDALARDGEESVIQTLLNNPNANISRSTMEYLAEQSKRIDAFQEPILRRKDLDPALAKRMYLWVSAALREYILGNFDIDRKTVDKLLEKAAFERIEAASKIGPSKSQELVERLDEDGLLKPDLLLKALQEEQIHLFVAMFGCLTGLRGILTTQILFEPGGEGLAIACKAIGINEEVFASIFTLSRQAKSGRNGVDKREMRRALEIFNGATKEAAQEVLSNWQLNPDYLSAIRQLKLGS